jgi:hypothetical protein
LTNTTAGGPSSRPFARGPETASTAADKAQPVQPDEASDRKQVVRCASGGRFVVQPPGCEPANKFNLLDHESVGSFAKPKQEGHHYPANRCG